MTATDPHQTDAQQTNEPVETMWSSIAKSVTGLALFAIITAGLIALTQVTTADRIEQQVRKAKAKALLDIVPLSEHNNDMLNEAYSIQASELGLEEPEQAFVARQDGLPVSLIIPLVAPDGYTGPIRMLIGIDMAGQIKGVRVVEHKETPGLGDKIELQKSDWIRQFDGRSLDNTSRDQWKVKKEGGEFDQLTGATITPRAIVRAVRKALVFYRQHQSALLATKPGESFSDKAIGNP